MHITSEFDSGNIICDDCSDPRDIQLRIRNDHQSDFYQWFYFRLTGARDQACRLRFTNAGDAAYAEGWPQYQAVASYDREYWFRVSTQYNDGELIIEHQPELDAVYYAYFAPYTMERHHDLVATLLQSPRFRHQRLGATLDGQDMDLLLAGSSDPGLPKIWIIGRQHPGETMAEWWMEGFLDRLADEHDPVSRDLLRRAALYIVPNMNPDGSRRGHLRTNACGANLNREWRTPTMERSPEVYLVRAAMHEAGVNFCLDVHGDEALPYNFIAGGEGVNNWSDHHQQRLDEFKRRLQAVSPDFQTTYGYPVDPPNSSDLKKCTEYVAATFDCLSMTLEMPFKDTVDSPDEAQGWSPERCRHLGRDNLAVIHSMLDQL
ncbi:MAG: M14-type cytosolic carboxypeptidase [Wenzhouxiangellaceae bacterium]